MDSDEYFDNIIEVVDGDSDKENSDDFGVNLVKNSNLDSGLGENSEGIGLENKMTSKQTKTTKDQFGLIAAFMDANDEETIGKDQYNGMWINLADELNEIGPPTHTSVEWRRIWSTHKYNKKRKMPRSFEAVIDQRKTRSDAEHAIKDLDMNAGIDALDKSSDIRLNSKILEKLVSLNENQAVLSNAIIERLDKSNCLLKDISKSIRESISSISKSD